MQQEEVDDDVAELELYAYEVAEGLVDSQSLPADLDIVIEQEVAKRGILSVLSSRQMVEAVIAAWVVIQEIPHINRKALVLGSDGNLYTVMNQVASPNPARRGLKYAAGTIFLEDIRTALRELQNRQIMANAAK